MIITLLATAQDFFGNIEPPPGVDKYGSQDATGLIFLFNNILKAIIFIGAAWTLINFIIAGIQYIGSSGKPELVKSASSKIWISLLGLVIIASSIALAALIGLIFFGDSTAILNPKIPGAIPGGSS
ncbi:MAG: hypothetical protein ABIJ43_00460 [Candidatus Beckwithbacteria bacterium]|nr:hypothetical protein [Patescibacteria group bacterium]